MLALGFFKKKEKSSKSIKKSSIKVDWPDHVLNLDKKNFDDFIEKYPLSIIDFWAPWCAPCKSMAPRLRRLSKLYKGQIAFAKLNTQENQDIAKKYKISGIPHLIVFSYGKKISDIHGLKSTGKLKKIIENIKEEASL
jgi:thioredoxin 1